MTATRAYLDYNASAPLLPAAREAMVAALDIVGNPSSVHAEGRATRRLVEDARAEVAKLGGVRPDQVVFTSGASEGAALLLSTDWRLGRSPLRVGRLYVCAADHPCTLSGGRFPPDRITTIGVDADGLICLDVLRQTLAAHPAGEGPPLVSVHVANNETGVVQPVAAIAAMVREAGGIFVADAVQAAGRIPIAVADGADFLLLSAHKIGGPKGVGAVILRGDVVMPAPLVTGGAQERGHRAGTENVAGIAGFGAAAREAVQGLACMERIRLLRDHIEADILAHVPDAVIHGRRAERLPNTSFFSFPGMKAETAQIAFDLAGIALSAGSACSSGKVGPSHVLKAMGASEASALRVSIGAATTEADIGLFSAALAGIASRRVGHVRAVA